MVCPICERRCFVAENEIGQCDRYECNDGEMVERFPGKLALGLDAKNSMVATQGWLEVSETSAIELAKKFGDSESSRFVNGVLDQIAKKHAPADKQ